MGAKEETFFRLKNKEQESSFIEVLLSKRIPHASYLGDVIATSIEDRNLIEASGFELEDAPFINLGDLTLEERNSLKEKSRRHWLATRDQAIDELLAKYGC